MYVCKIIHSKTQEQEAGENDIAELIKMGPEMLAFCLQRLIFKIYKTERSLDCW